MMIRLLQVFTFCILLITACSNPGIPPEPIEPLPSNQQFEWHKMEYYAFVHFNMNTFTDKEWGYGDESPALFNPSSLDTRQWARIVKDAGMKGIILTVKHHDGFCLWPSAFTEHSVKNSPWKNGTGDVVADLAQACKEYGLKMGLYLSPWDRNHPDYGSEEYVIYYRNQLTELLTKYGAVFELWVDGANGGDGYYGGANEVRNVDRSSYYDWDSTFALAKSLQPDIVIFSDGGPDVRWVGNERGYAGETNWSPLRRELFAPGIGPYEDLPNGHEDGGYWVPTECDVSIRPGWYYHRSEDDKVKEVDELMDIYFASVGRNGNLLLNLPVDTRGLIHPNDSSALMNFKEALSQTITENLITRARVSSSANRGELFSASQVSDDSFETYWATPDDVTMASLIIEFEKEISFNLVTLQEYIPLGQRIKSFEVWVDRNGKQERIAEESTVGYKRVLRLPETTARRIEIRVLDSKGAITLSNVGLYQSMSIVE